MKTHSNLSHPRHPQIHSVQRGFVWVMLFVISLTSACDLFSSSSSSDKNGGRQISLDQYNAIKPGMTYDAVVKILGKQPAVTTSIAGNPGLKQSKWIGSEPVWNMYWTEVTVIFQDDIVTRHRINNSSLTLWYKFGAVLVTPNQIDAMENNIRLTSITRN